LAALVGVADVAVSAEECAAYLKVSMAGWDEEQALKIIQGEV